MLESRELGRLTLAYLAPVVAAGRARLKSDLMLSNFCTVSRVDRITLPLRNGSGAVPVLAQGCSVRRPVGGPLRQSSIYKLNSMSLENGPSESGDAHFAGRSRGGAPGGVGLSLKRSRWRRRMEVLQDALRSFGHRICVFTPGEARGRVEESGSGSEVQQN
ncbi:hypothetical protein C8R46DRAFT_1028289 [Mycena filopes]|nr:hypothetical protein C8R46DRAFT_1028289 [Mycena filopes]